MSLVRPLLLQLLHSWAVFCRSVSSTRTDVMSSGAPALAGQPAYNFLRCVMAIIISLSLGSVYGNQKQVMVTKMSIVQ
jgi:hypothetical protein